MQWPQGGCREVQEAYRYYYKSHRPLDLSAFPAMQLLLALTALLAAAAANSQFEPSLEDSYDIGTEQIIYGPQIKRGCIARGGNCDHSSADCCAGTACRCNLWGANCRCQRKGIFTKFG